VKKTLIASVAVLALAAGCGGKKTTTPAASNDPLSLPPPPVHQTTAVEAAPVTVAAPAQTPAVTNTIEVKPAAATGAAPVAGQKYKVKHGDTLFSLAKQAYGNGNQYKKIVTANPTVIKNGVLPEGATITIPN
jgi:nucleoid-associated protein YgaU